MNRSSFILALILVLLGVTGRAAVQVVFAPSPDVAKALEKSIESARESIDLAIYSFNDRELQSRMQKAVASGLKIRVILNKDPSFDRLAPLLEADGIDVRYVRPVMHHKFAIIDGPQTKDHEAVKATLLTGSSNWARVSYVRYDEDLLRITEAPDLTHAYQAEFNLLWEHSIDFGKSIHGPTMEVSPTSASVWFTSTNLKPYRYRDESSFRSDRRNEEGVCGKRIIQSIERAEKSIQIATTHFRRADLADALKRAVNRGVAVELLLDSQEFHASELRSDNVRFDEELAKAGVNVRYKFYSPYWDFRSALQMHCKYMIVDAHEVHTGSLNWSENSELKTMENLIAITDQAVIDAYVDRFQLKWNYGKGRFDALIAEVRKSKGRGPCSFAPLSLTAEQIAELRKSYAPGACIPRD